MKIIEQFKNSGALLEGHFLLTSGRHSDKYFEKFTLLKQPSVVEILCAAMAKHYESQSVDIVVGAATGGIILAHEVAKQLGTSGIFAERVDSKMVFRRGFSVAKGQKVLLVDDVVTTGGSIFELIQLVQSAEAEIIGIVVMFDRSGGETNFGIPTVALHSETIESWKQEECPLCHNNIPMTQRGRTGK